MGTSSSKQEDFTDIQKVSNEKYDKCDEIITFNKKFCIKEQLTLLEKYVKLDVRNIDKKSKLRMLLNPEFTLRKLSGDSEAKLALN